MFLHTHTKLHVDNCTHARRRGPQLLRALGQTQPVRIVQVGANVGDFAIRSMRQRGGGRCYDLPMQINSHLLAQPLVNATLVEPHPFNFATLQRNLASHGLHHHAVRAAVCNRPGLQTFYAVSDKLHSRAKWAKHELHSFDRASVRSGLKFVTREPDRFIDEIPVACMTADQILSASNLQPQEVDALLIDVEGWDFYVALNFMRLVRFRPRIIVLEANIAYAHMNKTIRKELLDWVRQFNYTIEPLGHDWFIYPCVQAKNVAKACRRF